MGDKGAWSQKEEPRNAQWEEIAVLGLEQVKGADEEKLTCFKMIEKQTISAELNTLLSNS